MRGSHILQAAFWRKGENISGKGHGIGSIELWSVTASDNANCQSSDYFLNKKQYRDLAAQSIWRAANESGRLKRRRRAGLDANLAADPTKKKIRMSSKDLEILCVSGTTCILARVLAPA